MASCPFNPASQEYADFLYYYTNQSQPLDNAPEGTLCIQYISSYFAVVHVPLKSSLPLSFEKYSYYSIPKLFTLLDTSSMEESGIQQVLNTPSLANGGRGTIIGIVDTGIDYTNPLFRNPDGTTRLLSIWDQTLPEDSGQLPPGVPDLYAYSGASYGTEFSEEDINAALESENPYALVPSRDENGHGTFLAGIAGGGFLDDGEFNGAAPYCRLAVVKLKPAKSYLRDFFLIRPEAEAYQENDIMMAIKYLYVTAMSRQMPLVILLGLGTNSGSHEGQSPLSSQLQSTTRFPGIISVVAAGNETGLGHHYHGEISPEVPYEDVEIYVGARETSEGFSMEMWSAGTDTFSVEILSPGGEMAERIHPSAGTQVTLSFKLVNSQVTVCNQPLESGSGRQLIFFRFLRPAEGIWRIRVSPSFSLTGEYNMWLPAESFISPETRFLRPAPYSTVTVPGNSAAALTIGAYNHLNDSIYIHSSRGFTINNHVKPDLAAPGVNVYGPGLSRGPSSSFPMTRRSGTSAAAAHAAGAAASLLSWGLTEGNDPDMTQTALRSYLIRGARRNPAFTYPNREWGYGILDLYQTFRSIS
ncbi:MAG TPA: S8 family peptidase [Candidatus Enterocloster faecavium]|uniref:S8 family peptidase n=1 Tax=Candidatus Enterocloster faecavium TaxID=2838560 RepID=A0A9D2L902_9FIRM|nr:S8 family peptidase [Candidatus Enterocloster faecavium]